MPSLDRADQDPDMTDDTPLAGKTLFITGASRGIGLAIGLRAARDGANIAIAAKTAAPHPKLPGTIHTAAKEIEEAGGKALPLICDVRDEQSVAAAVAETAETFGGIDICVNNASAISLTGTLDTEMKRFDLMHQVNTRGTFLVTKTCLPHLEKAENPHVLMISPPLDLQTKWFAPHTAYSIAKYGMSLCVLGMAGEFKSHGIVRQRAVAAHDDCNLRHQEHSGRGCIDAGQSHAGHSGRCRASDLQPATPRFHRPVLHRRHAARRAWRHGL
jgi:NAD(P)-dependent dehydrogenase (short-subunit alcohol dehydrogenase family)